MSAVTFAVKGPPTEDFCNEVIAAFNLATSVYTCWN